MVADPEFRVEPFRHPDNQQIFYQPQRLVRFLLWRWWWPIGVTNYRTADDAWRAIDIFNAPTPPIQYHRAPSGVPVEGQGVRPPTPRKL